MSPFPSPTMTTTEAIELVRRQGVVLESAAGSAPSLAEVVAGEPIRGSWWGHPRSHRIFAATRAVRASPEVLVCRLVDGKVTFVHRRLWPALVRLSHRLPHERLAQVLERHTGSGKHVVEERPFPEWVPAAVSAQAASLSEDEAAQEVAAAVEPAATREGAGDR